MTTIWNSSDQIGISVSDSGHRATSGSFAFNGIRATSTILGGSTRKVYLEFPNNTLVDGRSYLGFLEPTTGLGGTEGFLSLNATGTSVALQGGSHPMPLGAISGHNISWAVDFGAKLCWVRMDGGDWNNSGTANPATGVGALGWAGSHDLMIASALIDNGGIADLNAGDRSFVYTAPAGFSAWEGVAAPPQPQPIVIITQ